MNKAVAFFKVIHVSRDSNNVFVSYKIKKTSNDQEMIQSEPKFCAQNQTEKQQQKNKYMYRIFYVKVYYRNDPKFSDI